MIIFGTRGKVLPGKTTEQDPCPYCESTRHHTLAQLRYFHIFWIPFVTIGRKPGMECTHCKYTRLGDEVPQRLRQSLLDDVLQANRTWPYSFGLIALGLLFALGIVGPVLLGVVAGLLQ